MSRYRKVDVRVWGDEKFKKLSGLAPSGQALWLFLLTTGESDVIPGVIARGRAALAEVLHWDDDEFNRAWAEVEKAGMAVADWGARLVWLPKAIEHNAPQSPNVVLAWERAWDELPECNLKRRIGESLGAFLKAKGSSFEAAWKRVVSRKGKEASE